MRLVTALLASSLACATATAEEVRLALGTDSSGLVIVTVELSGFDGSRLLESLAEGLESSVTFELRLYRKTRGLRSLLGDRLVAQTAVERRASMDFLDGRYILVEEGGETRLVSGAEDFVREFLVLRALRLPWTADADAYLIARARLEYVRLEAPLHIVALFRPTAAVTEWRRVDLTGLAERVR